VQPRPLNADVDVDPAKVAGRRRQTALVVKPDAHPSQAHGCHAQVARVVLGLALLSTWLHADLHATTIVVIEYQGQVIIAADSLASTQFPGVTRSACKIRYINGMAVALTGPINNPEVEYDAWLTVRDVLRTTTSPRNAIGIIARLLLEPLRAHVQFEQRESLPRYQRLVDGDGTVFNIILSAIENDRQILLV